nr:G protein-coupled receptor [Proales similis]
MKRLEHCGLNLLLLVGAMLMAMVSGECTDQWSVNKRHPTSEIWFWRCTIKVRCDHFSGRSLNNFSLNIEQKPSCCSSRVLEVTIDIISRLDPDSFGLVRAWFNSSTAKCPFEIRPVVLTLKALPGIHQDLKFPIQHETGIVVEFQYSPLRLVSDAREAVKCDNQTWSPVFAFDSSALRLTELFHSYDLGPAPIEEDFGMVTFGIGTAYNQQTCDSIFSTASIAVLNVTGLFNSAIKQNVLAFTETRSAEQLNSNIRIVHFHGYELDIDRRLFASSVFASTEGIKLYGTVRTFEANVLKASNVSGLSLQIVRLDQFLRNNLKWLDCTNERVTDEPLLIDLNDPKRKLKDANSTLVKELFTRQSDQYESLYQVTPDSASPFDDKDFCIFQRIKQKGLRINLYGKMLQAHVHWSCTCTLVWIEDNLLDPYYVDLFYYGQTSDCERRRSALACDLAKMEQMCAVASIEPVRQLAGAVYEFVFSLQYATFIVNVCASPAVALLSVAANLLIVCTFRSIKQSPEYRKSKLTDKNRRMWDYLALNCFVTLLQGVVFSLAPLTECVDFDGIFCSPLVLSRFGQLFYLLVQSYTANVLRLMANVTNCMFVLYRYAVNRDCWPRLRRIRCRRVLIAALLPALLISSIKLLINERFNVLMLGSDPFDYLAHNNLDSLSQSAALKAVYMVNMLLGNVFFSAVTFGLDLRLLIFLKRQKSERRKEETESRITNMILLNGLFSLLFRAPEILVSALVVWFTFEPSVFPTCILARDATHSTCPMMFQLARFVYSFSFFENLILLVLFKPGFRRAMHQSTPCRRSKDPN